MKRLVLTVLTAVSIDMIPAQALAFQPGEHVTVRSSNQTGTVLEDNGTYVKVHIDSSGYSTDVGVWYERDQIIVAGSADGVTAQPGNGGTGGAPTNSYQSGKRITAGNRTGTVLEDTGKLVKIYFDNSGYSSDVGVWFEKDKLNESGGASGSTVPSGSATPKVANSSGNFAGVPGHQNQSSASKANFGSNQGHPSSQVRDNASQPAPASDRSAGVPPDGIYQCNKISIRSYIHIGTIEIRGGTYKGFSSQQGSFHPYRMDASGGIVWTGGLTGMPEGWTLKPATYIGPDYKGHPLIRIYYTSNRGAAEVIDAVKEK